MSFFADQGPPAPAGRAQGEVSACDHADCDQPGLYRAPKGRARLKEYFHFCLEHVRAYNRAWDYCAGMSEAEIEAQVRAASCWDRPTWRLGQWQALGPRLRPDAAGVDDPFDLFSDEPDVRSGASPRPPRADGAAAKALATLELAAPASWAEIKARYKQLVKRFHPDATGGDKAAEERLKTINQAYTALKSRTLS